MDNYIGRMLDNRYEILEVIGMGGMAVVYKAHCHRLNRLVAIKVLKDEYSQDAEFRRRFHAESQAVAMLSHPNIMSVFDVSHSSDRDYIVMELIDGITLKQYMEQKIQLSWREALHFSSQIAKALEHAHSRGIIHRDIKPHNIMILKDGSVKVADFGIARITSAQSTLTREALGSVHYISPEQARGSRVDERSDLYSLGVVMYEMLTGKTPFNGESPVAVAIQHINGTPIPPRELNPSIPEGLEQITMHAMCASLENRYQSASDLLADLEEFRKNPNVVFDFSAPAMDDETHVLQSISDADLRRATQEQPPKRRTEKKPEKRAAGNRLAILAGVIAILLVIVGVFGLLYATALKDLFAATEEIAVPQLVGKRYDAVAGSPDYDAFVIDPRWVNDLAEAGLIIGQDPREGSPVKEGAKIVVDVSLGPTPEEDPVTMPPLEGATLEEASARLSAMNFTPQVNRAYHDTVERDRVISTSPAAGTALAEGQLVILTVSDGPEEIKLAVPSLTNLTIEKAIERLVEEGFTAEPAMSYVPSEMAKDIVISQSIDATTEVSADTVINLLISEGPPEENQPETQPETQPEETPPEETTPEPVDPWIHSVTLTDIPLPQDRVRTTVTVTIDGKPWGTPETYDTALGTFDLSVMGTGMQDVAVFFDGYRGWSQTVDFGS